MAPCDGKVQKREKFHESILFSLIIGANKIVSPKIKYTLGDNGHILTMSYVDEVVLRNLKFPTNDDTNNNKLTLVKVSVYEKSNIENEFLVPGLDQILAHVFNCSNSQSVGDGAKFHRPFEKVLRGPGVTEDLAVHELVDILTGLTGFTQPTRNIEKQFVLTFSNACTGGCPPGDECVGAICSPPYSG
jgi:hypothetical protein